MQRGLYLIVGKHIVQLILLHSVYIKLYKALQNNAGLLKVNKIETKKKKKKVL